MEDIYQEAINSNISNLIPSNIKSYIIELYRYENHYQLLYYKSYTFRNGCDTINEEKKFYLNMYNEIQKCYFPLLNKYPVLKDNYVKLLYFLKNKLI